MTAASQRRTAQIWTCVALGGFVMILAPLVLGMEMGSGGGALLLVGLVALLVGAIVAGIYFRRASMLRQMLSDENVLARWDSDGGEVIISTTGLLAEGQLYTFRGMAFRLRELTSIPSEHAPRMLKFTIEVPSRDSLRTTTVEVAVPAGETQRAREVAAELSRRYLR